MSCKNRLKQNTSKHNVYVNLVKSLDVNLSCILFFSVVKI